MRWIPTRAHGVLDYLWGILLASAPWLLGFAHDRAATWTAVAFGAGAILYSLLTDYELGVARVFSMRAHLLIDFAGGLLLAASPWLFTGSACATPWRRGCRSSACSPASPPTRRPSSSSPARGGSSRAPTPTCW